MMKKLIIRFSVLFILVTDISISFAEVFNPSRSSNSTNSATHSGKILKIVNDILKSSNEGQPLMIKGRIKQRVDDEAFLFQDVTGTVKLYANSDAWRYISKRVDNTSTITILGDVTRDSDGTPAVEAIAIVPSKY